MAHYRNSSCTRNIDRAQIKAYAITRHFYRVFSIFVLDPQTIRGIISACQNGTKVEANLPSTDRLPSTLSSQRGFLFTIGEMIAMYT